MAIQSSFFGVTKLTGADAEKFRKQFTYGKPNQAAADSLARGKALVKSMDKKGFAIIKASKKK